MVTVWISTKLGLQMVTVHKGEGLLWQPFAGDENTAPASDFFKACLEMLIFRAAARRHSAAGQPALYIDAL